MKLVQWYASHVYIKRLMDNVKTASRRKPFSYSLSFQKETYILLLLLLLLLLLNSKTRGQVQLMPTKDIWIGHLHETGLVVSVFKDFGW